MNESSLNLDTLLGRGTTTGLKAGEPCVIGRTVTALPEPYRTALQALLDDRDNSHDHIEHALRQAGLPGRHSAISKHRRGSCSCPTPTPQGKE